MALRSIMAKPPFPPPPASPIKWPMRPHTLRQAKKTGYQVMFKRTKKCQPTGYINSTECRTTKSAADPLNNAKAREIFRKFWRSHQNSDTTAKQCCSPDPETPTNQEIWPGSLKIATRKGTNHCLGSMTLTTRLKESFAFFIKGTGSSTEYYFKAY